MISDKMYGLGSKRSTIRDLFEYGNAAAEKYGRENIYDFSLGNPSVPPPDCVNEAIKSIVENEPACLVHGYTSAQGDRLVRSRIADYMSEKYGISLSADNFYMTCGAAAALCITFKALTCEGDEFIALAPFFPEYKVFVEGAGAVFTVADPDYENFQINFPALEAAINKNTKGVIINSPNNPSGAVYSEESIKRLAALLKRKSEEYRQTIYLVSDEPYREITYGAEVPFPPLLYPDTIVCYSYSKSLSLPGERIGYILIPDSVKESPALYAAVCGAGRTLGYVCAPSLLQKVVAQCQGAVSGLSIYKTNRDLLYNGLTAIGYECVRPDGAFYMFVKAPGGDSVAFGKKAKLKNLLLVPGDGFGCPGYVRIAYCVDTEVINRALPVFRELWEDARR